MLTQNLEHYLGLVKITKYSLKFANKESVLSSHTLCYYLSLFLKNSPKSIGNGKTIVFVLSFEISLIV